MADNFQTNIPTTTGLVFAADEVVISTATVLVQRLKIHLGTDGTTEGDVGAGNPLPITPGSGAVFTVSGNVTLAAGTATVGTVALQSNAAVALNAGTATIGTVFSVLRTATGGNIPADTVSGLGVKFVSAQPVTINGGTATIGTVALQAAAAVALNAGTATIGNVNLSTGGGIYLKTATGGDIPADTTSGLAVKFVNAQAVNSTLQAGTATIGTVALQAGASVVLGAGTATIGTVNANFASGSGFFLKTATGGTVPADVTSGLMVRFGAAQDVNLATGQGFILRTPTGGDVPADTTSGLGVKFVNAQPVTINAGTATVGSVILSPGTATVGTVNINAVPAGTATIGSVILGAGTATAGTVHLATTESVTLNTQPSTATDARGPRVTNVTASGSTSLATAPGTNTSLYITSIMANNTATTVSPKLSLSDGSTRVRSSLAANGGGFVMPFNPPWKLPGNTALNASVTAAADIEITVHYYTGAT